MSEFKRYTESCMEGGGVVESKDGEFVDYSTYAGAQSELFALREELAALKNHCADLDGVNGVIKKARDAAEQRNAELIDIIDTMDKARWSYPLPKAFQARITAALNPTESGASE